MNGPGNGHYVTPEARETQRRSLAALSSRNAQVRYSLAALTRRSPGAQLLAEADQIAGDVLCSDECRRAVLSECLCACGGRNHGAESRGRS